VNLLGAHIGDDLAEPAPPLPAARVRKALTIRRSIEAVVSLAYLAVRSGIARVSGRGRARLVILYYHAVPAAHRVRFIRQLDMIEAAADAVVPADFCGAETPGRRLVAVTFDDAYTSVVENALPELAARRMPATIFTPSGMLGRPPSWQMEDMDEDRRETVATAACLQTLPPDLVTIGAHSITHPCLPEIDHESAMTEISGSKSTLTGLLGRDVTVFSFPYGEYDDRIIRLCEAAQYRFVYNTMPWTLDPADAAFLRGRVRADLSDWPLEFWLKIRGAYSWKSGPRRFKRWLRTRRAGRP